MIFFLWLWNTNIQPEGLCAIRISIWWDFFAHRPDNTQIIFTFTTPQTIETEQRQGDKRKTKGELINTNEPFCVCVDAHPRFFLRVYAFCVCTFFAYILVRLSPSCTVRIKRQRKLAWNQFGIISFRNAIYYYTYPTIMCGIVEMVLDFTLQVPQVQNYYPEHHLD